MSVSPSKQAAISAYRNLLKTQRQVFTGKSRVHRVYYVMTLTMTM